MVITVGAGSVHVSVATPVKIYGDRVDLKPDTERIYHYRRGANDHAVAQGVAGHGVVGRPWLVPSVLSHDAFDVTSVYHAGPFQSVVPHSIFDASSA